MNPVQELLNLDWQVTLLGIFTIVGSGIALVTLWKQFCQIFGIKFAFLEKHKAELAEIAELKIAMEKMNENCEKHTKAMEHITDLTVLVREIKMENQMLKDGMYQVIGNAAENRIRSYMRQGYIPEAEYDSFCDFLDYAIGVMHCNHGLDKKYKQCKEQLPMLSVEEAAQFLLEKNNEEE